jgi:phosphoribosylformimino-5-aminoimidazole carboxamide ribotide isomerase
MGKLLIIPAIDLKGGKCVRLRQGRAAESRVYSDDPVAMAAHWVSQGAEILHVVDLDGAFQGRPVHTEVIRAVAAAVSVPVEVGGGLRTEKDIEFLLGLGVRRVILGTRAYADPDEVARLAGRFGDRLAVSIDAREGRVQIRGWVQATDKDPVALASELCALGVRTVIYTDTSVDGMLTGPNLPGTRALCAGCPCDVIASGGISSAADIRALRALNQPNLIGAIVGKALYEGNVSLPQLLRASSEPVGQ